MKDQPCQASPSEYQLFTTTTMVAPQGAADQTNSRRRNYVREPLPGQPQAGGAPFRKRGRAVGAAAAAPGVPREGGPTGPTAEPLGKIAKFAAIGSPSRFRDVQGTDTQLLQQGFPVDSLEGGQLVWARMERWALQTEAARALCRHNPPGKDPWARIGQCTRYRLASEVICYHYPATKTGGFGNLVTCGSVWCCPLCSARVSERRRAELVTAVSNWRNEGHTVALLTLTFPHGAGDDLGDILDRFLSAWRKLTSWRAYKELAARVGLSGSIRALEVTHGDTHGWHPHGHVLMFLDGVTDLAELRAELYALWVRACLRAGLPRPNERNGLDVRDGTYAARYVAKQWGIESELTKAISKHGRSGNRTPWDLLRSSLHQDDARARGLFRVYADAFKGKKQLVWSRGLRAKLGLDVEETDEELAAAPGEGERTELLTLDGAAWRKVNWAKVRGRVAEIVGTGNAEHVLDFLERLPDAPALVDDCRAMKRRRPRRSTEGERHAKPRPRAGAR